MSLSPEHLQGNDWVFGQKSEDPLLHAFQNRKIADPRFDLAKKEIPNGELEWRDVLKYQGKGKQAAYVHIPYCLTKCSFCRFFQNFGHDKEAVHHYASLLIEEINFTADALPKDMKPIEALYFGGGTPTILSADDIGHVLQTLRSRLSFKKDAEITFEARLKDLDDEKIDACIENGVNRFSIGIQSFDTKVRRLMSRSLDKASVMSRLSKIVGRSGVSVSVDLIYGLPYQDEAVWEDDLKSLIESNVDEVDLYQLDDTFLKIRFDENYSKLPMADVPTRAKMYSQAVDVLRANGYSPRNNTHWAKSSDSRNLYTSIIRTGAGVPQNDLISFGSGAIGKSGRYQYHVSGSLDRYEEGIRQIEKPIDRYETIEDNSIYELMCQLDSGVVDLDVFTRDYGIDLKNNFSDLIYSYVEIGLFEVHGNILQLTDAGRFWKNNISLAFCILNKLQGGKN